MPIKREDAKRALELLEDYHGKLNKPQDAALRASMEKVIQTFRSRLFSALLDIQEYYEITLLDERRTDNGPKVAEMVASRVAERKTPVNFHQNDYQNNNVSSHLVTEEPLPPPPPELMRDSYMSGRSNTSLGPPPPAAQPQANARDYENWEYHEIELEKGTSGLGFSISGGTDNPHVGNDPSIFITKLIEGGLAARDGRLKVNDIIVSVNSMTMESVSHAQSVAVLKQAGNNVRMVIKRPKAAAESIIEVNLKKGPSGLGFSIGGGTDNQHYVGDNAVYITKLTEGGTAQQDGRLSVGDKIIAVNDTYLHDVTHEEAVAALKATKERVRFLIAKPMSDSRAASPKGSVRSEQPQPIKQEQPVQRQTPPQQKQPKQSKQEQPDPEPEPEATATYAVVKKAPKKKPKPAVAAKPESIGGPRKIILKKGSTGLGFNIVGGEDGEGIFVSLIQAGGPADQSGQLKRGDQLLSVNGIDLRDATHEQAAAVLKGSGETVEIYAQHRPEEYHRFEAKIHDLREQMMSATGGGVISGTSSVASSFRDTRDSSHAKQPFFIKALFDFEPADDSGMPEEAMSFRYGDVMQVTSSADGDWWQAKKIVPDEDESGIIPSKASAEEMEREKRKKAKAGKKKKKSKKKADGESSDDEALQRILTYDIVISKKLKYARPVLILGPLKDRINDDLIADFPDRFGTCIPHTTRPQRPNEVDGTDYHFVASREQMELDIENRLFIEFGQFNNNLYGTHAQSVIDVAKTGKHCILDVSGNAIKRLEAADLYPIAIFVKADTVEMLSEWDSELDPEQAQKAFEKMKKIEEEFGDQFSATVGGDSADEVYAQVKDVIREQSGPVVYISA